MQQKRTTAGICLIAFLSVYAQCNKAGNPGGREPQPAPGNATVWVTKADSSVLLKKSNTVRFLKGTAGGTVIEVDHTRSFQEIDGFGYTLTGGSAMLINRLDASGRTALLRELFGNGENSIGVSYLRISVGASDLDPAVFSYNDLPAGQTDPEQEKFSIAPDKANLVPVLKEILVINPKIKILASPWSPPAWMKDNGATRGGSLKPEYYASYARYLIKYIRAMKAEGITIDALTPQNEPLHPGNNPSLLMLAAQQRDFIKNQLGPAFKAAGIHTKIVVYDHNLDRPDYPITILDDPGAKQYIDGSAFHLYAGNVSAMSQVHDAHPDRNLYFTEQWTGSKGAFSGDLKWHIKNVIIGTIRNWSRIALEWNLASDPGYNPHTPGGCTQCKGALTLDGNSVNRNVAYYIIAHASKFVPAGSRRIYSSEAAGLSNVAFVTAAGRKVLIVLNEQDNEQPFHINCSGRNAGYTIPANAVVTIVW
ncbi:glycoside hydrolase family 30 protein [Niabella drilacis]|uniref:Glucosylceramidase n=1 Tax=Niabella drilacis (strain DSM 25811 / CCM 8410 / CCUG 62505 / LMG 26954 / E90) TaxID=1285928 RepID=A0A1G6RCJ9_NIADE|nr:glycoside hydrolase family 30 beta sandwich domain-containing protein [Niabella drilacis]SDD01757.1 glucosylceramidase [Niabella drilacis]